MTDSRIYSLTRLPICSLALAGQRWIRDRLWILTISSTYFTIGINLDTHLLAAEGRFNSNDTR